MAAIAVQAVQACLGLTRGDVEVVERTPFVDAVLADGRLRLFDLAAGRAADPPWGCPVCQIERDEAIDRCANCGSVLAPERGLVAV